MNKIQRMIEYISDYKQRYDSNEKVKPKDVDDVDNLIDPEYEFYYYVSDIMGYSKFPLICKNKDYSELNRREIYHGYDKHIHGANYIWDFCFHYGKGEYGQGTYFSTDFNDAMSFTGGFVRDETKVLKAKVLPARIVKFSHIQNLALLNDKNGDTLSKGALKIYDRLKETVNSIENQETKNLMDYLLFSNTKNYSALAILMGYDVIENDLRPDFFHGKHYIILNRSKLVVSEKDAKILFKKSGDERYKDLEFLVSKLPSLNK